MPKITGTPLCPPRMSDEGHGSRTSIAHHHPAPKGENPRDYPQESATQDDAVTRTPALEKGFSHGSRAHGGPQLNRQHASGGEAIPSRGGLGGYRGPDKSCGIDRGGRGTSG